jgi:hypothetical protein
MDSPPHDARGSGAFCSANAVWKSGVRLSARSGWISSTTRSKGTSWWA